jgi:predicted enzyme related to lactoylglutathione lyase
MNPRIVHFFHRARDVLAARAFYGAVLGDAEIAILPLPEPAAARRAPAHWLGAIELDDIEQALVRLLACGATLVGPVQRDARGAFATVRDAGGALLALITPAAAPRRPVAVVWSHLDARDAHATFGVYSALFGWQPTELIDFGHAGRVAAFAWEEGGLSVGSYSDTATRPSVHPQWLYQFRVDDLESAVQAVRAQGGVVLGDVTSPNRGRVVVCDDPQGGAFAIGDGPGWI